MADDDVVATLSVVLLLAAAAVVLSGAVLFGYGVISWALTHHPPILVGTALMLAGVAAAVGVLSVAAMLLGVNGGNT